jgi:hypothetical protein
VHYAGPWIEMTPIQAELAQDRDPIDPRGGRLCRLRVTLERAARRGLFPRGERAGFEDA